MHRKRNKEAKDKCLVHTSQFSLRVQSHPTLSGEQSNGHSSHARPNGQGCHLRVVCSLHTPSPRRLAKSSKERESEKLFPSRSSPLIPLALASGPPAVAVGLLGLHGGPGSAKLGLKAILRWHIIIIIIIMVLVVMTITQMTMSVLQLDVSRKHHGKDLPTARNASVSERVDAKQPTSGP